MSRETNEAIQIRNGADDKWREHYLNCSQCGMAKARRRPAELCLEGAALKAAAATAARVVKANRELDAQPIEGQGEIWPADWLEHTT